MISPSQFNNELIAYNFPGIFLSSSGESVDEALSKGFYCISAVVDENSRFYPDNGKLHIYNLEELLRDINTFHLSNRAHMPIILIIFGGETEEISQLLENSSLKSSYLNPQDVVLNKAHSTGIHEWPLLADLAGKIVVIYPEDTKMKENYFTGSHNSIALFNSSEIKKPNALIRFFVLTDPNKVEKRDLQLEILRNSLRIVLPDLHEHKKYSNRYLKYLLDKKVNLSIAPKFIKNPKIQEFNK